MRRAKASRLYQDRSVVRRPFGFHYSVQIQRLGQLAKPLLFCGGPLPRSFSSREASPKAHKGPPPGARLAGCFRARGNLRAALDGKVKSRYIALPLATTKAEREQVLAALEKRADAPEQFISGVDFTHNATSEDPIAVYDALTGRLRVNGLHPFIGAFFEGFVDKSSGLPLEVFAMAEVLLESHLHDVGLGQAQIDSVMTTRDQLLQFTRVERIQHVMVSLAQCDTLCRSSSPHLK
jgi:hypothetical protein